MNRIIITLLLFSLITCNLSAQINLIGVRSDGSGSTEIIEWEAFNPTIQATYPTPLQGYYLNSSVYDAWNGNYYITGLTSGTGGLLSFNSISNTQTFSPFTNFSNITEIDMSTGKIYTLTTDSIDYFSVNEYDIATGTDSLIGIVYEPNSSGIIVDATGFDSNHGILYYCGFNSAGGLSLYALHVRGQFWYSKVPVSGFTSSAGITSLNYDNATDRLFALLHTYFPTGNQLPLQIVEIDTASGVISVKGSLNGFSGYQVGSSAYDQQTGNYLLAGVDTSFNIRLIVFSTADNTWQTSTLPDGVSEIVCDNYLYARSAYGITGAGEPDGFSAGVFPQPASDLIRVSCISSAGKIKAEMFNMQGISVASMMTENRIFSMPVGHLSPGLYLLKVTTGEVTYTRRVVIAR